MSRKVFGEWVMPNPRKFFMGCCDCGLTHEMQFRIADGFIQYRVRRAPRYTAAQRKRLAAMKRARK